MKGDIVKFYFVSSSPTSDFRYDSSDNVVDRLNDFQSSLRKIPKSFRDMKAELSILPNILEQINVATDNSGIRPEG
jgi:hypothetical protein